MKKKQIISISILLSLTIMLSLIVFLPCLRTITNKNATNIQNTCSHIDSNVDMKCDKCEIVMPIDNYLEPQKLEVTSEDNTVAKISGNMPKNTSAEISKIENKDAINLAQKYINAAAEDIVAAYDISLNNASTGNLTKYQPGNYNKSVKVELSNIEIDLDKEYVMLHVLDNNEHEFIPIEKIDKNRISFNATSFSSYILMNNENLATQASNKIITIIPNSYQWKYQGSEEPEITYMYISESADKIPAFSGKLSRVEGEEVGLYAINLGSLTLIDNEETNFVASEYSLVLSEEIVNFEIKLAETLGEENKDIVVNGDIGDDDKEVIVDAYKLEEQTINVTGTFIYNGQPQNAIVEIHGMVKGAEYTLVEGKDYTLTYTNNINAGTATVTITGSGDYSGELVRNYEIDKREITITPIAVEKVYGAEEPEIKFNTSGVVEGQTPGFTGNLSRVEGNNVGEYEITLGDLALVDNEQGNFLANNYSISLSEIKVNFEVKVKEIEVVWGETNLLYNGTSQAPTATALTGVNGESIELEISGAATNVGSYTATATIKSVTGGNGEVTNYTLANTQTTFTISSDTSMVFDIELDDGINSFEYDGTSHKPAIIVKVAGKVLAEDNGNGGDYTVSYKNNKNVGTATIEVKGVNNYAGIQNSKLFTITPRTLTVTPDSGISKVFGEDDPTLGYTYSGNVIANNGTNGETILTEVPGFFGTLERAEGEAVKADYLISLGTLALVDSTAGNFEANNYVLKFSETPVYFEITAKSINALDVELSETEFIYTGEEKKPTVTIVDGETVLIPGTDYTVEYDNNINVGENTAVVIITGQGNYTGEIRLNFTIKPATLEDVTVNGYTGTYNGLEHGITVNIEGARISYGETENNYDLTLSPKYKNVGTYTVYFKVEKENYESYEGEATVIIEKRQVSVLWGETSLYYDGTEKAPTATVNTGIDNENIELTILGGETQIGTYTATAEIASVENGLATNYGLNNETVQFSIIADTRIKFDVTKPEGTFTYNGLAHTPAVNVIFNGNVVTEGIDYTIDYGNNVDAGEVTIRVIGQGGFENITGETTFTISPRDLIIIPDSGLSKKENETDPELTYTYSNNVDGEIPSFTGNLVREAGEEEGTYPITLGNLKLANNQNFKASNYKLNLSDSVVEFEIIAGKTEVGSGDKEIIVQGEEISEQTVTVSVAGDFIYNGQEQKATVEIKGKTQDGSEYILVEGTDYTLDYDDPINAGTVTITITGLGNYKGTTTKTYEISKKSITVTPNANQSKAYGATDPELEYTYSGNINNETPLFTGKLGRDSGEVPGQYKITLGNLRLTNNAASNFNANNYNLELNGEVVYFRIMPKDLEDLAAILKTPEVIYNGEEQKPKAIVTLDDTTLLEGIDYTISYENNIDVGTATAIITAKEGSILTGEVRLTFTITPRELTIIPNEGQSKKIGEEDPELTFTYSNNVDGQIPSFTGKLSRKEGENEGLYAITLGDLAIVDNLAENFLAKNYTIKISEADVKFEIIYEEFETGSGDKEVIVEGQEISNLTATVTGDFIYNGQEQKATVEIKGTTKAGSEYILVEGTDYTLDYDDPVNAGTVTITITGIGNFKGTRTETYEIGKATIVVTPNANQSTVYGDSQAEIKYTHSGAVATETPAFTGSLSRTEGQDVGTYIITLGDLTLVDNTATGFLASNYNLNLNETAVEFTINPKEVAVEWTNTTLKYNGELQAPTAVAQGVLGDTIILEVSGHQINVGIYTATASIKEVTGGNGKLTNYILTNTQTTFTIEVDTSMTFDVSITGGKNSFVYNGTNHMPEVTVKVGNTTLESTKDYTVSYENNKNVGTASIKVTGTNNYAGIEEVINFTITKRILTVLPDSNLSKNVGEADPEFTFTYSGNVNAETPAFSGSLSRINGKNAGLYTITLGDLSIVDNPAGNFLANNYTIKLSETVVKFEIKQGEIETGSGDKEIIVQGQEISEQKIDVTGDFIYNGQEQKATVIITKKASSGDYILVEGTDYTLDYDDPVNAGTVTITITGIGNFKGTTTETYEIGKATIIVTPNANQSKGFGATDPEFGFTHTEAVNNETPLFTGSLERAEGEAAGKYAITLGSLSLADNEAGNFKANNYNLELNSETVYFEIIQKDLGEATAVLKTSEVVYDGQEQKPKAIVSLGDKTLIEGIDYTISYENNINVGTATAVITPVEGTMFIGEIRLTFTITSRELIITPDEGQSKKESEEDPELTFTYSGNVDAETPGFTGNLVREPGKNAGLYPITLGDLALVDNAAGNFLANNYTIKLSETVVNFEIIFEEYESGSGDKEVIVEGQEIAEQTITVTESVTGDFIYNGQEQKATVEIKGTTADGSEYTLVEGTDYTLDYDDPVNAGTVTITITGIGTYKGTTTKTYEIGKATITVTPNANQSKVYGDTDPELGFTHSGAQNNETPLFTGSLERAEGEAVGRYAITLGSLSLADNEAGNFKANNYNLELNGETVYFEITQKGLGEATAVLTTPEIVYNGEEQKPKAVVTVGNSTLVEGVDYTISYENNINAGTATAIITAKEGSSFDGEIRLNFTIIPRELIITPDEGQSKKEGEQDPELTFTYSGNIATETPGFSGKLERVAGNNPGSYIITLGDLALADNAAGNFLANNYTIKLSETIVTFEIISEEYESGSGDKEVIVRGEIADQTINVTGDFIYNGQEQKATVEIKGTTEDGVEYTLVEGTDYTLDYDDPVNAGTVTITITGIGNYNGTTTKTYEIGKATITVTPNAEQSKVYGDTDPELGFTHSGVIDGETPKFSGNLDRVAGEDIGLYAITIGDLNVIDNPEGNFLANNYTVELSDTLVNFEIKSKDLSQIAAQLKQNEFVYDGTEKQPEVTVVVDGVELEKDKDYTVSYENNVDASDEAKVIITGIGNYAGTEIVEFVIEARELIILPDNGQSKKEDEDDPELTFTYTNNLTGETPKFSGSLSREPGEEVGEYAITLGTLAAIDNADGNFKATNYKVVLSDTIVTFEIIDKELGEDDREVIVTAHKIDEQIISVTGTFIYNGQPQEAIVEVQRIENYKYTTLVEGTDYTLEYRDNINAGTATVIVTGIGNYSGTAEKTYEIGKKKITITPVENQSKIYGEQDPEILFTHNGVIDGETPAFIGGLSKVPGEIVGSYEITLGDLAPADNEAGNFLASNYELELNENLVVFDIVAKELVVEWGNLTLTYNGMPQAPTASVETGVAGEEIILNVLGAQTNVGEYQAEAEFVSVEGGNEFKQNYVLKGTTATFNIVPDENLVLTVEIAGGETSYVYDGEEKRPEVIVKVGDKVLEETIDYTVTYSNNIDVGTAVITVSGTQNYEGAKGTITFQITERELVITPVDGQNKDFGQTDPELQFTYSGHVAGEVPEFSGSLVRATGEAAGEYLISLGDLELVDNLGNNFKANNYALVFSDEAVYFTINANDLSNADVSLDPDTFVYTGNPCEPNVIVVHNGKTLVEGTDYTVRFENNVEVGTATAIIEATENGNYVGRIEKTFTITAASIEVESAGYTGVYDGQEHGITVNVSGATITYGTEFGTYDKATLPVFKDVGTYTVYFKVEKENYETYTGSETVTITQKVVSVIWDQVAFTYSGTIQSPIGTVNSGVTNETINIKVTGGQVNVGTYTAKAEIESVTAIDTGATLNTDNYKLINDTVEFTIAPNAGVEFTVIPVNDSFEYDGTYHEPDVVVKHGDVELVQGIDYTVQYSNNKDVGTATITILGKGNYLGSSGTAGFMITKRTLVVLPDADLSKLYGTLDPELTYTYYGNLDGEIPQFTGELTRDIGEDVGEYLIRVGTLNVVNSDTFSLDNYDWKFSENETFFRILPRGLSVGAMGVNPKEFTYDGTAKEPETIVRVDGTILVRNVDYIVEYDNNVNVGTATARAIGIGNYKGILTANFTIKPISLIDGTLTLNPTTFEYDGTRKTPDTTVVVNGVTLIRDKDYVVTYHNNIEIGDNTASAVATGIGNYEGELTATFSITAVELRGEVLLGQNEYVYDKTEKCPTVTVVHPSGAVLVNGLDYTVTYENNIDAGTATVIITGTGVYTGEMRKEFIIKKASINLVLEDKVALHTGNGIAIDEATVENAYDDLTSYITYKYYDSYSSETPIDGLPVEIGIYYAEASITGHTNYEDTTSQRARLVIYGAPSAPSIMGRNEDGLVPSGSVTNKAVEVLIYGSEIEGTEAVEFGYKYSLDGNTWVEYTEGIEITKDGTTTIWAKAYLKDNPEVESEVTKYVVTIDNTDPVVNDIIVPELPDSVVIEVEVSGDGIDEIYITEDPNDDPSVPGHSGDWDDIGGSDGDDDEPGSGDSNDDNKTIFELTQGDEEKTIYVWVKDAAGNIVGPFEKKITLSALKVGNEEDNKTSIKFKVTDLYLHTSDIKPENLVIYVNDTISGGTVTNLTRTEIAGGYEYTAIVEDITGDGEISIGLNGGIVFDKAGNNLSPTTKVPTNEMTADNTVPNVKVTSQGSTVYIIASDENMKAVMVNGKIIARTSGTYEYELEAGINKIEVIDEYGNEVVQKILVEEGIANGSIPNTPILKDGMVAVYWEDGVEKQRDFFLDGADYDYTKPSTSSDNTESRWANAKTLDGSYWVWIPRYAYKVTYYTDSSKTSISETKTEYRDFDVIFLSGKTNEFENEFGEINILPEGYKVAEAFGNNTQEGGWNNNLEGFWVSKYEMSCEESADNNVWVETTNVLGGGNQNTTKFGNNDEYIRVVSKPNVDAWTGINVSNAYQNAYNMYREYNSHLAKNSEWEATFILAESEYGRNGNFMAIDTTVECGGTLETTTTGNITGVFDLIGGTWEYVATYISNDSNDSLQAYASELVNETKAEYKQEITEADIENMVLSDIENAVFEQTMLENPYLTSLVVYRGGEAKSANMTVESIPVAGSPDSRIGYRVTMTCVN